MFERIMGIIRLDKATYEGIEKDESATRQALYVVLLVGLLIGVGAFISATVFNNNAADIASMLQSQIGEDSPLYAALGQFTPTRLSPIGGFLQGLTGALLQWVVWSAVTFFVGTRFFGGQATFNEMLRLLGFAQAPRLLNALSFIPCVGALIGLFGSIWWLVTSFVAIRQGLNLSNGKTVLTIIVSWLVTAIAVLLLGLVLGMIFSVASGQGL